MITSQYGVRLLTEAPKPKNRPDCSRYSIRMKHSSYPIFAKSFPSADIPFKRVRMRVTVRLEIIASCVFDFYWICLLKWKSQLVGHNPGESFGWINGGKLDLWLVEEGSMKMLWAFVRSSKE